MPDLFEPDVELRWRGKETKVKTVSLPFQTVRQIDLWSVQASQEQRTTFEQMRQAEHLFQMLLHRAFQGEL